MLLKCGFVIISLISVVCFCWILQCRNHPKAAFCQGTYIFVPEASSHYPSTDVLEPDATLWQSITISPTTDIPIELNFIETERNGSTHLFPCSFEIRNEMKAKACSNYSAASITIVHSLFVNVDDQILVCRNQKVASKSTVKYFSDINGVILGHPGLPRVKYNDVNFTFEFHGYRQLVYVPVHELKTRFQNFTRIVMVRHPLQRLVSAYIERIKQHKMASFDAFVELVYLDPSSRWFDDIHWRSYPDHCMICDLDYHYIIKTETLDPDLKALNSKINISKGISFPHRHYHKLIGLVSSDLPFKYDNYYKKLESSHPVLLKQVLDKLSRDMEMFGYTWRDHNSYCENKMDNCC